MYDSKMGEVVEGDRGDRWSQLHPELLHLIYRNLPDMGDFVRFRAVCNAWRDAAPVYDTSLPPLPWILEHRRARSFEPEVRSQLCFYSLESGEMYNLRTLGRRFWILGSGTGQGYVVGIIDFSWTLLYNPITGTGRKLPPPPFMQFSNGVFSVLDDGEADCMVVNTCTKKRYFAFYRPRVDTQWKVFNMCKNMGSNTYNAGRFYVNTDRKETLAIDVATLNIVSVVPRPSEENFSNVLGDYLVSSRGKLLRAIKHLCSGMQAASEKKFYFNVYQLDILGADGMAMWTKVDSIGNTTLFFDDHGHGFSLEPNNSAGLRKDCVYFVRRQILWLRTVWADRFLCRYNMEDKCVDKTVLLGNMFTDTWVVPSMFH